MHDAIDGTADVTHTGRGQVDDVRTRTEDENQDGGEILKQHQHTTASPDGEADEALIRTGGHNKPTRLGRHRVPPGSRGPAAPWLSMGASGQGQGMEIEGN
ncbi:hypothetical protein VCV18_003845 [Metarhizium anisopliae]